MDLPYTVSGLVSSNSVYGFLLCPSKTSSVESCTILDPHLRATILKFLAPRALTRYACSGFASHSSVSVIPVQLMMTSGRLTVPKLMTSSVSVMSSSSRSVFSASICIGSSTSFRARPICPLAPAIHTFNILFLLHKKSVDSE